MLRESWQWNAALAGGCLLTGVLTLGPTLWPQPNVPMVTRAELPMQKTGQTPPQYPTTGSVKPVLSGRLNLNTATQQQLEALPGIGPAMAKRIIQARPINNYKDLDAVKGVGPSTLKKLEPFVKFAR